MKLNARNIMLSCIVLFLFAGVTAKTTSAALLPADGLFSAPGRCGVQLLGDADGNHVYVVDGQAPCDAGGPTYEFSCEQNQCTNSDGNSLTFMSDDAFKLTIGTQEILYLRHSS